MLVGSEVNVAIVSPVSDMCASFWAYDLARLPAYSGVTGIKSRLMFSSGSLTEKNRQRIADVVMGHGTFTHMLWLDSDMRFPPDTLERLLKHDKDMVCASYTERTNPFLPVAFPDIEDTTVRGFTLPDTTGLAPIDACGFGCSLIKTEVFKNIERPYFVVGWTPHGGGHHVGEDLYFYIKAKNAGYQLWMDHDLTKELAHIGRYEFDFTHALRAQAQREAQQQAEETASGNLQLVQQPQD